MLFFTMSLTLLFFLRLNENSVNASIQNDSGIRPVINGSYDSYVNNPIQNDEYKDPSDVNDPGGTVYAHNANELLNYIGYSPSNYKTQKSLNDPTSTRVHKIILTKDISLSDASNYSYFATNYDCYNCNSSASSCEQLDLAHKNLVIDGQGHTLDMMFNDIYINTAQGENWTLENMKILGSSKWGPFCTQVPNTTFNYRNIDYYGSQLFWGKDLPNIKCNIYGNVGVHSLYTYKPLKGNGYSPSNSSKYKDDNGNSRQGYLCEGSTYYGNQRNFQTGNIEFHSNSNYFGENYNGNSLEIYGSAKIDDNANIELHPHGYTAKNAPSGYGSAGLYLYNDGSNYDCNVDMSSNDSMKIYCNNEDVSDSDAGHYAPYLPSSLSCAFYANNSTNAYINRGHNSKFMVYAKDGAPYNNNPLVNIESMNAYVSGENNGFYINDDASNTYIPYNGLLNTDYSNINVTDGGSFNMNIKNIPNSSSKNYLLYSTRSVINLNRPKEVSLLNSTYNKSQNNLLNYMTNVYGSTRNYINAENTSFDGKMYDPNIQLNDTLVKKMILPITGSQIFVPGARLLGSYFNNSQLANALSSTISGYTAKNFNYIDFKGTPIPKIKSLDEQNVNTHSPYISGKVTDDDGNSIKNSYVKLKLDDSSSFIQPDDSISNRDLFYKGNDNYTNYINSKEVLYNPLRNYIPDYLGEPGRTNMVSSTPNFYSSISGNSSYPTIRPELQNTYFGYANKYFFNNYNTGPFNQLNAGTTTYDKNGQLLNNDYYVAMTDNDGNFKFKVPQDTFNSVKDKLYSYLNVVPSYNFSDGDASKVLISYNPLVSINNTLKDISYPKASMDDGKNLQNVFQGGQGKGSNGDTLEFDNSISNKGSNSDFNDATYTQPVPSSIDDSNLIISYDNGNSFNKLDASKYTVSDNNNGTKNIIIKGINVKSGDNYNIALRGTMKNNNFDINNDAINLKPTLSANGINVSGDNNNSVSFTDDMLKLTPNDIDFGQDKIVKDQVINQVKNNNSLISSIQDNRRDKTLSNIDVQQNDNNFYNNSDSSQYFSGQLFYDNLSLNNPVKVFETDNHNGFNISDSDSFSLIPKQSFGDPGNYSTKLTWTVNNGIG